MATKTPILPMTIGRGIIDPHLVARFLPSAMLYLEAAFRIGKLKRNPATQAGSPASAKRRYSDLHKRRPNSPWYDMDYILHQQKCNLL